MLFSRRHVALLPFLPLLPHAAFAAADTPRIPGAPLAFRVIRNESEIGLHTLTFSGSGGDFEVRIDVEIAVKLGPIALYRYVLKATERWEGGRFVALDSQTNNDGEALKVTARLTEAGLQVRGKAGEAVLPAETLPLTHWNRQNMRTPLFNPQDGKPMRLTVAPGNEASVKMRDGQTRRAQHFQLRGEAEIDDWYDEDGRWIQLRAKAKDGSTVDYVL